MPSLSDYVSLSITLTSAGVARAGFGVPMIPSYSASWPERARVYGSLADVAVDFPVTTSPEYLMAAAIFAQQPAPTKLMIGRFANKPTMTYQLSAISPTANISYKYQVKVKGQGVTPTTVEFTSDANPTDAEYAAGMVAALNAVVGKNYTASGSASPITITGNAAGGWFSIEVVDANTQKVLMTHADPGVAADLTAVTAENPNWYAHAQSFNSNAIGLAIAAWIEANKRIFVCDSNDTNTIITSVGNGDLVDDIKTNAYTATMAVYHPDPSAFLGCRILGRVLPIEPGSETFHGKKLAGVAAVALTATHRANLVARYGGSYESPVTGTSITFEGKTGDGNYLDVKRGVHWLEDDLAKEILGVIVSNDKVPFTDPGIAVIEGAMRRSLKRATLRGILADSPAFTTVVPLAADVSASDKALRRLTGLKFSGVLAGAVHAASINGTISVS